MWAPTPFAGYSVEFSPFRRDLLAVGTAQYYGMVGNGRIHVFDISGGPGRPLVPVCDWVTKDGAYDVSWSEDNEHVLVSGQADGTVKLFDWTRPEGPIMSLEEHQAEVSGVDWNLNTKQLSLRRPGTTP